VTQNVMLKAWERRSQFHGDSEFRTWLYRIAVNAAVDARRGIRNAVTSIDEMRFGGQGDNGETPGSEPKAPGPDVIQIIYAHELLERLSSKDKEIIKLKMQGWHRLSSQNG